MATPAVSVRRLVDPSESEVKRVAEVLRVAFGDNDPFTAILVGGDMSLVPEELEANARAAALGGEIHVATTGPDVGDIVGVAIWFGPGQGSMATEEQRTLGWNQWLAAVPNSLRAWWVDNFIPAMGRLEDESLGKGFKLGQWHLHLFGVVPEHHRKGIGKALMTFVEERARADRVSIVLETTTDVDVIIYKRLGFTIKGRVSVTSPYGDTQVYQMVKTP